MAWIYQLSVECGEQEQSALSFAKHFEGESFPLSEGLQSTCSTRVFIDTDKNWWAIVAPSGLSRSGVNSSEEALDMTIAGRHLYERLLSSPPFRYAIAGVETEVFRTFSELKDTEASLYPRLHGLVMTREIWEMVGSPSGFVEFREGYLWLQYLGEEPPSR